MGLHGVDGEHRHVLNAAGNGTGNHELPEMEAIVGRHGDLWMEIRGLRNRAKIGVFEFGRRVRGHEWFSEAEN